MRFRIINDDEIGSAERNRGERRVAACFIQGDRLTPDEFNEVNVNRAISDDVNRDLGTGLRAGEPPLRHELRGQPKARCT